MRDRILGLKQVPVSKLRGFQAGNPKTYSDTDSLLLDQSLENHGYVLPIAVRELGDGTYEVLDGHHRLELIASKVGDDAKIKVVVLDVASVEEGRRILLALKHNADWDMSKLETFIEEALQAGATANELMADTGLTSTDVEALANASRDLLAGGETVDDDDDDSINEGPSRAGLNPEHVPFSVPLTRDQSKNVRKAIKMAKQVAGVKVHGDALVEICAFYVSHHRKQAGKTTSKKKRKRA